MMLKIKDKILLTFGSFGTQLGRIDAMNPRGCRVMIGVRRYRASSKKWNKAMQWYDRDALIDEMWRASKRPNQC